MTEYDKFLELIGTEDIKQRNEQRKKNDEKLKEIRPLGNAPIGSISSSMSENDNENAITKSNNAV